MKDPQIRSLLRRTKLQRFITDGESKVVDELILPVAKARIDMAVVNGYFHGYEIKSASDTLQRLPLQVEAYSKVFDYLTIVTEGKYHLKLLDILPEWVGISVCVNEDKIEEVRPASLNTEKAGFYIAKLLWRDELISVLVEHNIAFSRSHRNWTLCEILSQKLDIETLSSIVRTKLKKRVSWKA